jgi:hypothetical protein
MRFLPRSFVLALLVSTSVSGQVVFPTTLEGYLQLTAAQVEEMRRLKDPANRETNARRNRVIELSGRLSQALMDERLDVFQLGSLYAEAVKLHTTEVDDRRLLANQLFKVLTPEQVGLLNGLMQVQTLSNAASAAVCDGLIAKPSVRDVLGVLNTLERLGFCAIDGLEGYYRGLFDTADVRPPNLPRFLELTTEQSAQIREVQSRFGRDSELKAQQLFLVVVNFLLTEKRTSDPMELGRELVAMETIRRDMRRSRRESVAAVQALLNEEQLAKLRSLEEARRLIWMEEEARCSGFLNRLEYPMRQGIQTVRTAQVLNTKYVWGLCFFRGPAAARRIDRKRERGGPVG